ncbi:YjdF family protein [Butyricicoccus faecihominis]|uniref:YjdF family protein n=1 Tax=Butyricicoccaceae TaxID=3085642 RepID=UPI002478A537|nr:MULTISPECIES: YjdF family protein [Butyricicoccaceae]MCQ5129823.1 YjdF family protein [Butyricicoccus faecihominis]WNX83733.1 YjdF family protein [Agathobaculum sp. NTUH-O15-33]
MRKVQSRVTVFFDDPFWVGVYERETEGRYEACKWMFGAEPRDYEVYAFLLQNWRRLRFSPPVRADGQSERRVNPKRMQRAVKRELQATGVGTKAQQALAAQREQGKEARRVRTREEREREQAERYAKHQQKRKEKHRGH